MTAKLGSEATSLGAAVKARLESIPKGQASTTSADPTLDLPEPNLEEFDTAENRAWPAGIVDADWTKVPPGVREALKYAIEHRRWPIYLTGSVGSGKSYAAAVVYKFWRRWASWYSMPRIVMDVISCRTNKGGFVVRHKGQRTWEEFEANIFAKLADASLVVFDDVGLRDPTPAAFEVFYMMVEARRGKPTIYTSNLDGAKLAAAFDERIASRLLCGQRIVMKGADRRMAGGRTVES